MKNVHHIGDLRTGLFSRSYGGLALIALFLLFLGTWKLYQCRIRKKKPEDAFQTNRGGVNTRKLEFADKAATPGADATKLQSKPETRTRKLTERPLQTLTQHLADIPAAVAASWSDGACPKFQF